MFFAVRGTGLLRYGSETGKISVFGSGVVRHMTGPSHALDYWGGE